MGEKRPTPIMTANGSGAPHAIRQCRPSACVQQKAGERGSEENKYLIFKRFYGVAGGTRAPDPLITKAVLSLIFWA